MNLGSFKVDLQNKELGDEEKKSWKNRGIIYLSNF